MTWSARRTRRGPEVLMKYSPLATYGEASHRRGTERKKSGPARGPLRSAGVGFDGHQPVVLLEPFAARQAAGLDEFRPDRHREVRDERVGRLARPVRDGNLVGVLLGEQ